MSRRDSVFRIVFRTVLVTGIVVNIVAGASLPGIRPGTSSPGGIGSITESGYEGKLKNDIIAKGSDNGILAKIIRVPYDDRDVIAPPGDAGDITDVEKGSPGLILPGNQGQGLSTRGTIEAFIDFTHPGCNRSSRRYETSQSRYGDDDTYEYVYRKHRGVDPGCQRKKQLHLADQSNLRDANEEYERRVYRQHRGVDPHHLCKNKGPRDPYEEHQRRVYKEEWVDYNNDPYGRRVNRDDIHRTDLQHVNRMFRNSVGMDRNAVQQFRPVAPFGMNQRTSAGFYGSNYINPTRVFAAVQEFLDNFSMFHVTFRCPAKIGKYICKMQCAVRDKRLTGTCEYQFCNCIFSREKAMNKQFKKLMDGYTTDCSVYENEKKCKKSCKALTADKSFTGLCKDNHCQCVTYPKTPGKEKNACTKAIKKLKQLEDVALTKLGVKPRPLSAAAEKQLNAAADEAVEKFKSNNSIDGCTEEDIQNLRAVIANLSHGLNLVKDIDSSGTTSGTSSPKSGAKGSSEVSSLLGSASGLNFGSNSGTFSFELPSSGSFSSGSSSAGSSSPRSSSSGSSSSRSSSSVSYSSGSSSSGSFASVRIPGTSSPKGGAGASSRTLYGSSSGLFFGSNSGGNYGATSITTPSGGATCTRVSCNHSSCKP